MKAKIIFSFVATLLITQVSLAQFHIGVKGGANITKVDGQSFKDQFNYGYHLGGFAQIKIANKLEIQPEVLFSQFSTTLDSNYNHVYENVFNSSQSNVKLNYLSIPVLLNYKLIGNFMLLQVGPQFGILMNQDKTLLQNGGKAFSDGDFSMLGGVQFKLSAIRISGRYAVGLKDINDIDNKDRWTSQSFQVSLGLAL
jgi:hypothetical protein